MAVGGDSGADDESGRNGRATRQELLSRIRGLEAELDDQQQTLQRMLPSRRDFVVGSAAGLVGAGLMGQASADASTTDPDGDVGTPSNRLDVFADGVDSNSVDTEEETLTANVVRAYEDDSDTYSDYKISDYSDIGAAINDAASNLSNRGTIVLPAGTHTVSTRIVPQDFLGVRGQGRNMTVFQAASGLNDDVIGEADASTGNINSFEVTDLKIDGNVSGQSSTSHGIYGAFSNCRFINLDVRDTNGKCIWLASSGDGSNTDNNKVKHCRIDNPASGHEPIKVGERKSGSEFVGAAHIVDNDISDTDHILVMLTGNGHVVRGNRVFTGGQGVRVDRGNHCTISENLIQIGGSSDAILVIADSGSSAVANDIHDNIIKGDFSDAIRLQPKNSGDNVEDTTIHDNVIDPLGNAVDNGIRAFGSGALVDVEINYNRFAGSFSEYSIGCSETRVLIDGWGENAGDPSSTGDWNGNGREGVSVVDTSNNTKYVYRGGSWV